MISLSVQHLRPELDVALRDGGGAIEGSIKSANLSSFVVIRNRNSKPS